MEPPVPPVLIVGAGPGDPGLVTVKGLEAIRGADVLLFDHLVHSDLVAEAPPDCERIDVGKFGGKGPGGMTAGASQEEIHRLLEEKARAGKRVVRLKGGDPFVFGRGGEEALFLAERGIPFEVVPGVTAALGAAATAGIPLTQRGVTASLHLATGHEDPSKGEGLLDWEALGRGRGTVVLYMAGKNLADAARRLVAAGRARATPAAVVEWATLPRQRVVEAPLAGIAEAAERAGLAPPTILLLGDVVSLRARLDWFSRRPLSGRVVLVTRARAQASELARRLEALGAWAIECPAIRLEPIRPNPDLDEALRRIPRYRWAAFLSPNAVALFAEGLSAAGLDARALAGVRIAAIGPGTAARLAEAGLRPDLEPAGYTSGGVLESFRAVSLQPGDRVLLPRGEEGSDVLPEGLRALGFAVDELALYRAVREKGLPAEAAALLGACRVDAVAFASSSAARFFAENLSAAGLAPLPPTVRVAAIGPSTAEAARLAGFSVHAQASPSTIPGLAEAVSRLLAPPDSLRQPKEPE